MGDLKNGLLKDPRTSVLILFFLLFLLFLLYLFFKGFENKPEDLYRLVFESDPLPVKAAQKKGAPKVIYGAHFDPQGFPVSNPEDYYLKKKDEIIGDLSVLEELAGKSGISPQDYFKNYQENFKQYWLDPNSSEFSLESEKMGQKLLKQAGKNQKWVKDIVTFLKSDAAKEVSANLKDNILQSAESPARGAMKQGFSAWQKGDRKQAMAAFRKALSQDPNSSYIRIIAHQSLAFLNMEIGGPLEETIRQFRDLAEESHRYISSFRGALEKAGFDPVKLYGRDPFDKSGLPTSAQLEKAMDNSAYVKFERDYYKKNGTPPGKTLDQLLPSTLAVLKKRQKGGGS